MNKKRVKLSIKWEILGMALIPLIFLAVILTVYSEYTLKKSLQDEALSGLEDLCYSVMAGCNALDKGDYRMDGENLFKGDFNLTEDQSLLDDMVKDSTADVTVFYDKTRRATSLKDASTGEKIIGTDASAEVVAKVLEGGQIMETTSIVINNSNYYACYIPLKNSDGSIIGMVFAGKPSTEIDALIFQKMMAVIGVSVCIVLIGIIVILILVFRISRVMTKVQAVISGVTAGDLNVKMEGAIVDRKDELGVIACGINGMIGELRTIMRGLSDSTHSLIDSSDHLSHMANQTNTAMNEIERAADDVSKGAVSQAEEVENATTNVSDIGQAITKIVEKIDSLNQVSETMESAQIQVETIVSELSKSSDSTFDAAREIEQQVKKTDESVSRIQDAVTLISSIAEETNLLSLNASIEAARAGDAGRGFAVVATQIQKLAEESNRSAIEIAEVIENLAKESKDTVDKMNVVQQAIEIQREKLQETKTKFKDVSVGINSSREETKEIKQVSDYCDKSRISMVDEISNLSAISEENAASTEQTMASIQNLNSSLAALASQAEGLKNLSDEIGDNISFFKVDDM